jgi:hypothetical protein
LVEVGPAVGMMNVEIVFGLYVVDTDGRWDRIELSEVPVVVLIANMTKNVFAVALEDPAPMGCMNWALGHSGLLVVRAKTGSEEVSSHRNVVVEDE